MFGSIDSFINLFINSASIYFAIYIYQIIRVSIFTTLRKQMGVTLVGFAVVASVVLGIIALIVLYFTANSNFSKNKDQPKNLRNKNASIVVVIGSGK